MKKLSSDLIYNAFYQVMLIALPVLTMPFLSRTLGPNSLGISGYVSSISSLMGNVMLLGLNQYGVRKVAEANRKNLQREFLNLWGIQIFVGTLLILVYCGLAIFFLPYRVYFLLQLPFLIGYGLDISWLYIGMQRIKKVVLRNTFVKLTSVFFIFLLIRSPDDLWKYILINSLGILCANFIFLIDIHNLGINLRKIKLSEFNFKYLKPLLFLSIPLICAQLYTNLDSTIVGSIAGTRQLAFYDQSQKVARLLLAALTSASTVIMPRMVRQKENEKKMNKLLSVSLDVTFFISLIVTLLIMVNTKSFILLFFGPEFLEMDFNMFFVSLIIIFIAYGSVFSLQYTLAKGLYRIYTIPYIIGAVFSIILNLILVPYFGANGGTVVIVLTEFLVCILRIGLLKRNLDILFFLKGHLKAGIAFIITVVIISNVELKFTNPLLSILCVSFISLILFFFLLLLFRDKKFIFLFSKGKNR